MRFSLACSIVTEGSILHVGAGTGKWTAEGTNNTRGILISQGGKVAKRFSVTRDGTQIYSVMRDRAQIGRVRRDLA